MLFLEMSKVLSLIYSEKTGLAKDPGGKLKAEKSAL